MKTTYKLQLKIDFSFFIKLMHLVISHKGCPDGRAATYIYSKMFQSRVVPAEADEVHEEFLRKLDLTNVTHIAILDLTIVQSGWDFLESLNVELLHIDHHIQKPAVVPKKVMQIIDHTQCACVLLWKHLHRTPVPMVYQYIQDRDLFKNELKDSNYVISGLYHKDFLNNLEKFEKEFNLDEIIPAGKTLVEDRLRRSQQMISFGSKRQLTFEGNTYSVLLVKGDGSLKTDACTHAAGKYDIGVFYEYDIDRDEFWLSWRSKRVNVSRICSKMISKGRPGGGHEFAAGSTICSQTTFDGRPISRLQDVFELVDKK